MPVSDRRTDNSCNHETIQAPLHHTLLVLACEGRLLTDTAIQAIFIKISLLSVLHLCYKYFFNLQERNNITVYQQLYLCE